MEKQFKYILLLAHTPFSNDTVSGVAAQAAMLEPYTDYWELVMEGGTTPLKDDWTVRQIDGIIDPQGDFWVIDTINCAKYNGCYWALIKTFFEKSSRDN